MLSGISDVINASRALMILTQPNCCPTISCLYEMCAAGGGISKLYRLRFPLNPDEMIRGCCKTFIGNYLPFAFENDTIMADPAFSVPEQMLRANTLNRNESFIRKDKLSLGDTGQFCLLPLLPEMPILSMLDHVAVEHPARCGTVDVAVISEYIHAPSLLGKP